MSLTIISFFCHCGVEKIKPIEENNLVINFANIETSYTSVLHT